MAAQPVLRDPFGIHDGMTVLLTRFCIVEWPRDSRQVVNLLNSLYDVLHPMDNGPYKKCMDFLLDSNARYETSHGFPTFVYASSITMYSMDLESCVLELEQKLRGFKDHAWPAVVRRLREGKAQHDARVARSPLPGNEGISCERTHRRVVGLQIVLSDLVNALDSLMEKLVAFCAEMERITAAAAAAAATGAATQAGTGNEAAAGPQAEAVPATGEAGMDSTGGQASSAR